MLTSGKLGFWGLTALVFGLMVGAGIYNLPQNMASVATPSAVFMAWMVTSVGILPLVFCFKWLSDKYPQYNAGIYQYAQAGFGNFAGFNIAWGYWLCTAFSNVAYGVILTDACGAFYPPLLEHGWQTVVFVSVMMWVMVFIVSRGIKTAKFVNSLLALVKVMMLIFIITMLVIFFKATLFLGDAPQLQLASPGMESAANLGSLWDQVRNCMMITLFCFFGVEGAVMMSARARRSSDVGKAGVAGFTIALVLYMGVSLLSYGLLTQPQLAGLSDPSIAYILRSVSGDWAYWFVISAVVISMLGGWVAWTLIVAQVPFEAAQVGILPRMFTRVNRQGMPVFGLVASTVVMELFLILVVMADNVYLAAIHITGLMVIPCYFFTALFILKKGGGGMRVVAVITALFCLWMAYAGNLLVMATTSVFYMLGFGFYVKARRENAPTLTLLTAPEKLALVLLLLLAIVTFPILYSMA